MRIDKELAKSLAVNGVLLPYRQIEPLTSSKFEKFLAKRDIHVGGWDTLHQLWRIGLLHPIAVIGLTDIETQTSILDGLNSNRFIKVGDYRGSCLFADFGEDSPDLEPGFVSKEEVPSDFGNGLLWHPFQLWSFVRAHQVLGLGKSWGLSLSGEDHCSEELKRLNQVLRGSFRDTFEGELHESFLRLVALLLEVEPLIHHHVFTKYTFDAREGYREEFPNWLREQDGAGALSRSGLDKEAMAEWHSDRLAFSAWTIDPIRSVRTLIRHAERTERERFTGDALSAHSLYDHAELLRRYAEDFHAMELPEELDTDFPQKKSLLKVKRYGSSRLADYDRGVFRRIARRFRVDPGYKAYLFVEGPTEVGFVKRWFELVGIDTDRAGARIVNIGGIGNVSVFEGQLEQLRIDEVFPVVCLDQDANGAQERTSHIQKLEEFRNKGLLPVDFEIWTPNFVEHHYSLGEFVEIVRGVNEQYGMTLRVTAEELEYVMMFDSSGHQRRKRQSAEDAMNSLVRQQYGVQHNVVRKGESWGASLADWMIKNPPPPEFGNDEGLRPIETILQMATRAETASYSLTRKIQEQSASGSIEPEH